MQPLSRLKAQHSLSPGAVCRALPISPLGMFGPLPFLLEPLRPFPFPFVEGAPLLAGDDFGSVLDLSFFGFSGTDDLAGSGRR